MASRLIRTAKSARSRTDWARDTITRLDRKREPRDRPGWSANGWVAGDKAKQKSSQTYPQEFVQVLADIVLSELAVTATATCSL
eukprot:9213422-Pyramimonas_sp.AAC.1